MKTIKTKETDAGTMTVMEDDKITRYEILTYPWNWRGWKIYFADKVVQILSGTVILTLEIDWKDKKITLNNDSWDYIIPAWIPNIFYFPETTQMVEDFPKWTKTKNFERYRILKNN
jgi:hypothetical protein